jgi:hypothetical protein
VGFDGFKLLAVVAKGFHSFSPRMFVRPEPQQTFVKRYFSHIGHLAFANLLLHSHQLQNAQEAEGDLAEGQ